ncbi:MAG: folate-binding protein YgfZ [Bdellovibrionales bacterium]
MAAGNSTQNAGFACRLEMRGIVRLGGADRRGFLQGLISNDIESCRERRGIYAALLTPQGKFLHDLFIVENGDKFLIDCEAARVEDLIRRLGAYRLRAKIAIEDARAEYDVWAAWNAAEARDALSTTLPVYADPRMPELGWRAIARKGEKPGGYVAGDYDGHRLSLGIADGSRDLILEKSTLAEGNFDLLNGISWTKGCYVGQELTARMHYRALVKKRLFPVKIESGIPEFGTIMKFEGEDIGDMRSSAGDAGLALLNIDKAEAAMCDGIALACGTAKLRPWKPEWMKMGLAKS